MKVLAFIEPPQGDVIEKILRHCGVWDTQTEARLQRALAVLLLGRTSFVVAHRRSTVRRADLILVLDRSRIAGTFPCRRAERRIGRTSMGRGGRTAP